MSETAQLLAEIRALRAELAIWRRMAVSVPLGTIWDSPTTHVSLTGTVRSGWTTPPPSYMHGHYLYDRPSMVGP